MATERGDRTAAERQRRYRRRQRAGKRAITIMVDEHAAVAALLDAGRLSEHQALDHGAVQAALGAVLSEALAKKE